MITAVFILSTVLAVAILVNIYMALTVEDDSFYGKNSAVSDPSEFNKEDKGLTEKQIYQREILKWTDRHRND